MKSISVIAIAAALVLLPIGAAADTHVKIESHTDGFYAGGSETPPDDSTREMWIGEKRMTYVTDNSKLIVDSEKKKLMFVNRRDNTYAETDLPLDMSKLFPVPVLLQLQAFQRTGTVKKTEEQKKIGEWACTRYDFNDWIMYEGGKVSERDVQAWVTTDVPFDMKKFNEMFAQLGKLSNLSDEYLEQLLALPGFQIATEETRYQEGMAISTTTKVIEMTQKEPPAEAYALPEGCTKKDYLTLQDLQ